MMMTICSKFGTRGAGVAAGVRAGTGVRVAVGRIGGGVKVDGAIGEGVECGGAGFGVQAASKTNRRNKNLEGCIRAFLKNRFCMSAKRERSGLYCSARRHRRRLLGNSSAEDSIGSV
jgi:hypothetical protein